MEVDRVAIGRKQGVEAERVEPAVDPRAALMRQLQQGAGNASVTRMLARLEDDVPSGPTEIEPHGPGDDKDTPGVLAEAAQQPDEGGIMGLLAAVGGAIASGAAPEAAVAAPAGRIGKSVGRGGANLPADVKVVGDLLRAVGMAPAGDDLGPAITRYQADALGWPQQDGRADPGGKTITALVAGQTATAAPGPAPATPAPAAGPGPAAPAAGPAAPTTSPAAPTTGPAAPTTSLAAPTTGPAAPTTSPAAPVTAPPAPAAAVPADLQAWAAQQPATNPDWAAWIIAAVAHGFVTIKENTRKQLDDFVAGKTVKAADGSAQAALLGGLATVGSMIRGRVTRWMADPSQGKQPFLFGDYVRDLQGLSIKDAHRTGAAVDIGGFDWDGPNGPKQVMQALEDLPAGNYGIGLPFQGQFFPKDMELAERKKQAKKQAGDAGTPADITSQSLVLWKTTLETSKFVEGKWVDTVVGYGAASHLKSAELKAKVAELKGKGKAFTIFPDAPRHIHIKRN